MEAAALGVVEALVVLAVAEAGAPTVPEARESLEAAVGEAPAERRSGRRWWWWWWWQGHRRWLSHWWRR